MNAQKSAWITIYLVILNAGIWLAVSSDEHKAALVIDGFAFHPTRLTEAVTTGDIKNSVEECLRSVSSMFIHQHDYSHVLFNMMFLLPWGILLERRLGSRRFAAIYMASGLVANAVYALVCPDGQPALGASSAVFGVLAASIPLYVRTRYFIVALPPIAMIAITVMGALNPAVLDQTGFAFWSHLTGAATGLLVTSLMIVQVSGSPHAAKAA